MKPVRTSALVAVVVVASLACTKEAPGQDTAPVAAKADPPDQAGGIRVLPLEVKPPGPGTVVGTVEVVVENTSVDPIPLSRIGAARPVWVVAPGESDLAVLRSSPLTETDFEVLVPGAQKRVQVRMFRVKKGGPVQIRGRLMVRDATNALHVIATSPVNLKEAEWETAEP